MNTSNRPVGMLILGVILVATAAIVFYKAKIAVLQHAQIPYRSGSMSPSQGYFAAVLCLGFGLFWVVLWAKRRKQ